MHANVFWANLIQLFSIIVNSIGIIVKFAKAWILVLLNFARSAIMPWIVIKLCQQQNEKCEV